MVPSRRSVLHTTGAAVAALAGCLSDTSIDPPAAATAESTSPNPTTAESEPTTTTRPTSGPATPQPTRARGEPISTRETYVDGEEYTYLPEERAVQYVSAYRHTNHEAVENGSKPERKPVYDTVSFEHWGEVRCASVAATAVAETTAERLGHEELDASVGVTSRGGVPTVVVSRTVTYDRQGNRISATDVPVDELAATAPQWVEATVSLAGRQYETTVPIWVTFFEQWQQ